MTEHQKKELVDPDPFILASICLQGAAIILQLAQIAQSASGARSSVGVKSHRSTSLSHLESAISDFDKEIRKAERIVRRSSEAPDKEFYEASFRISLGVMKLDTKSVTEYSGTIAKASTALGALTMWVGHIVAGDPELAKELGEDLLTTVAGAAERLNALMAEGAPLTAVLQEAKLVRDACMQSLAKRLDDGGNI